MTRSRHGTLSSMVAIAMTAFHAFASASSAVYALASGAFVSTYHAGRSLLLVSLNFVLDHIPASDLGSRLPTVIGFVKAKAYMLAQVKRERLVIFGTFRLCPSC